ncbi:MAG: CPBP family intramembrane glutamic endopeptidase [Candidatus Kapabacteria bacterium]|jgi:membrane protease YdiL (CAAX protease family)|nr:CPBP family intramembrane glutamic endopeptidase [Candidatus Kapabacteria bacterium]
MFWKEKKLFFYKEKDIFKRVILSLVIIYLFTVILDPFYRDFSKNAITEFKFNSNNFTIYALYALIILFIGSITEELIFRGIILERYKSIYQTIISVFVSSVLYSLSHFYELLIRDNLHFDVLKFFDLFLLGVVLSIIAIRYGLLYAIIAHVFYNLLVFSADFDIVNLFILDYIENNYYIWYFAIMCFLLFPFILFSRLPILT